MELTFLRPDDAAAISPEQRPNLVQENSDLCIIGGRRYFIRGVLPLPAGTPDWRYCIGLWVEVSLDTFDRVYDLWDSEDQGDEPPFAATIANEIPASPGSRGLAAELHLTGPTSRPEVFLKATDHPLYVEQKIGIDRHRMFEYAANTTV